MASAPPLAQESRHTAFLRLLQMADTALPIGAAAHSFGLETLTFEGILTPQALEKFLADYLHETGALEAAFCRAGYGLGEQAVSTRAFDADAWLNLNDRCGAWKPARESRTASETLGRRLLQFAIGLEDVLYLQVALESATGQNRPLHHAPVFGLIGGVFGLGQEETIAAYLQQMAGGLLSACQKLLPFGQNHAAGILWRLKPALLAAAQTAIGAESPSAGLSASTPLVDMGGMRHAYLPVRLFIS